ncbi:hypothetical protein Trydic_g15532 [Trypoxylus dichotomus]
MKLSICNFCLTIKELAINTVKASYTPDKCSMKNTRLATSMATYSALSIRLFYAKNTMILSFSTRRFGSLRLFLLREIEIVAGVIDGIKTTSLDIEAHLKKRKVIGTSLQSRNATRKSVIKKIVLSIRHGMRKTIETLSSEKRQSRDSKPHLGTNSTLGGEQLIFH